MHENRFRTTSEHAPIGPIGWGTPPPKRGGTPQTLEHKGPRVGAGRGGVGGVGGVVGCRLVED